MTRKSKREIERAIDQLKTDPETDEFEPLELTEEDRDRLDELIRDVDDLSEEEQQHLENIREWHNEEIEEGVVTDDPTHTTPAMKAWLNLMIGLPESQFYAPEEYYERYPDAPGERPEVIDR